jgi:hypothetical protein
LLPLLLLLLPLLLQLPAAAAAAEARCGAMGDQDDLSPAKLADGVYEGPVDAQGRPHATSGCMTFSDGSVYVGPFVHGERTGRGRMSWPAGADDVAEQSYEGDFVSGLKHGFGTFRWSNGNVCAAVRGRVGRPSRCVRAAAAVRMCARRRRRRRRRLSLCAAATRATGAATCGAARASTRGPTASGAASGVRRGAMRCGVVRCRMRAC